MPGSNAGGQLNLLVFEVGVLTRDPATGAELATTVSVHPLVVVPRSIRYSDATRSAVMQTTGGAIRTVAGRGLRTMTADGMFGVQSRGFGPYVGTGEVRFQRFYREVVRMSDALTRADVQAAVDVLTGTPGISALVSPFIEGASTFFVNFYDFWHDIAFQAEIQSFNWTIEHKNGGATGNRSYQLAVRELGPPVEGSAGNGLISTLLTVLGTWDDVNQVIESYTATAVLDAGIAVAAVVGQELADTVAAVAAQARAAQQVFGGNDGPSLATVKGMESLASFFGAVASMQASAAEVARALAQVAGSDQVDATPGAVYFEAVEGEGDIRLLALGDEIVSLDELGDAGAFQLVAGKLAGMASEEFRLFVASGGALGALGAVVASSVRHVVADTDTPEGLEARYGVAWPEILRLNGLTPDEALHEGATLEVPVLRRPGAQGVAGLPTFGSHVGQSAWGVDVGLELTATDGVLDLVSGPDVLVQGANYLIEGAADDILRSAASFDDVGLREYVRRRVGALLLTDPRIAAVDEVAVDIAEGVDVSARLRAINGGTLTLGGSP